jgi:hypothetical protein
VAVLFVTTMVATLWTGSAMAVSDSGAPSASSSQPATESVSLIGLAFSVGGVLVAMMAVVLTIDYGRRRIARRRASGRQGGTHAKTSRPRADGPVNTVADWPGPAGPHALHPDHLSWPGRPDPSWAGTEAILREEDYPSWPERPESTLPVRVRRDLPKP